MGSTPVEQGTSLFADESSWNRRTRDDARFGRLERSFDRPLEECIYSMGNKLQDSSRRDRNTTGNKQLVVVKSFANTFG